MFADIVNRRRKKSAYITIKLAHDANLEDLLSLFRNGATVKRYGQFSNGCTVWIEMLFDGDVESIDPEVILPHKVEFHGSLGAQMRMRGYDWCELDEIKTTGGADGQAVRQTRQYFTYQPGKSLLVLCTGVLEVSGGQTDITARIGYYDDGSQKTVDDVKSGDGFFFELAGTSLGVVQRSHVSGSQVDTRVEQGAFNIDTMDGNGQSGFTIDPSKANIYFFEQEWLGVGSLVMGVVASRSFIPCHVFRHANLLQTPYTSRASLPVRYELKAENTTANVGEMRQICSTVISEGGYTPIGRIFSASRGSTAVTVDSAGNPEVIIAMRKKSAKARVSVNTLNLELISASSALIHFEVWCFQSPASTPLSAESWVSANTNSAVEYTITSATCDTTNGIKLYSGYYSSNGNASFANLESRTILGNNIAGTSDILVITAESLGNNETVYGSASWQESG